LRVIFRKLNASPGASGPHAFAVHACAIRLEDTHASIASRAPRLVTIGRTPLFIEAGYGNSCTDFPKNGSTIFFTPGLDKWGFILINKN
jgi:hypothetical protein